MRFQSSVTVAAPAKVNLFLGVDPDLRPDGYHTLTTVFQALGLYDTVTVSLPTTTTTTLTVSGNTTGVPTDDRNLAWKAATLMAAKAGRIGTAAIVDIHIHKNIPVAGGMAGGSADAAATLVACNELWNVGLSNDELLALGAKLGADVPFCLLGHTALGTARGDELMPVLVRGKWAWVLAAGKGQLATPSVFSKLDAIRERQPELAQHSHDPAPVLRALAQGDAQALAEAIVNDLQPAAISLMPGLRDTLALGDAAGALATVVSGSGPTVAMLCRDEEHALDVAVEIAASGYVASVHTANGPVAGALSGIRPAGFDPEGNIHA